MQFDLCVVGGGSGGVRAARLAGAAGLKVILVERARLGGTCVNLGCIPKKLLVYAAHYAEDFHDAVGYGYAAGLPDFDWTRLLAAKDVELARLNGIYARLLKDAGCQVLQGHAVLTGPQSLQVGEELIQAGHILIATGSTPHRPDLPGAEFGSVSDDVFSLPALPRRAVVVGAGYIAVEIAGVLQALGVEVTLLHRGPALLNHFDHDVQRVLAREMEKRGVRLLFNTRLAGITREAGVCRIQCVEGAPLQAELLLFATGRWPNTRGLGLAAAGIETSPQGGIPVDAGYQSVTPSISAIGDVIERVALTPVAIAEAHAFIARLTGQVVPEVDYAGVPTAVFSQPAVGTAGLGEQAAIALGHRVRIYRSEFRPLRHALTGRNERCLVKLVVDASSDRVLGVHMVGPDAGEIIQGLAVALRAGATKQDFDRTLAIHPTFAEEFVTLRQAVE
jgi:glutathione reductase (NADPH)